MRAASARLPVKKRPSWVKPRPSTKKAKLMPRMKNRVLRSVRRRRWRSVRSSAEAPPARYPRYSGMSGSTQGEKKLRRPWKNTASAETLVSTVNPIQNTPFPFCGGGMGL